MTLHYRENTIFFLQKLMSFYWSLKPNNQYNNTKQIFNSKWSLVVYSIRVDILKSEDHRCLSESRGGIQSFRGFKGWKAIK